MKTKIKPLALTQFGNPILDKKAVPVPIQVIETKKFEKLIQNLLVTLRASSGVGIAAPQVGVSWQLVVIEIKKSKIRPRVHELPFTVLINPRVLRQSGAGTQDWEGCLSLPEVRAKVPRYTKIFLLYTDQAGKRQKRMFQGFQARVVQHELDHLKGIRYVERVTQPKSFVTVGEFKKRILKKSGLSSR